jgi:SAM-dependent methyltransferase
VFDELREINKRPGPFEFYTAEDLWADEHTSKRMLEYHLNGSIDVSSRKTAFIERSGEWIAAFFGLAPGSELLDLGCGPGLYANRFAERGIGVTGVDFSKRSIEYATRAAADRGVKADYINGNYLELTIGKKFDLITMIMCDYCALSPAQRKLMLNSFREWLRPCGSVLLDVYSLNSFNKKEESSSYELNHMDRFWSAEDYYCFINSFKYDVVKVSLDKYTIIERNRMRVVYNRLQHFSVESLEREFEENGLCIEHVFSDVAGGAYDPESPEFAVAAGIR